MSGTYFQAMVGRSPVAYWRLAGSAVDIISGHNGTLMNTYSTVGTASTGTSLVPGEPDGSIILGGGLSVSVAYGSWMDSPEFSFEGVFEVTGAPATTTAVVARASIDKFCWAVQLNDTEIQLNAGPYSDGQTLATGIYHYAVTGDADVIRLYLNGVEIINLPFDSDLNSGGAFSFGALLPGFSYEAFPGRLDEFVYYDFPLSPLDVYSDYQIWSLGQENSIAMVTETDTISSITPRYGSGQTYRRTVSEDDPWSYWALMGYVMATIGEDFGPNGHHSLPDGFERWEPLLGPTQTGVESPWLLENSETLESIDSFASSTCTLSAWVSVSPIGTSGFSNYTGPITNPIPLVTMAASAGSSTFDKCLYLDTSGRLAWLTDDGSVEVITDPTPFPQDGVARHVAVSVGAAGTKIRVNGTTVATGANTTSLSAAQKVFYFNGGTGGGYDFTYNGSQMRHCWVQATVYDYQLTDARTDEHWRVGRSVRNIEYFWGIDSAAEATLYSEHALDLSGQVDHYSTSPGILPSDPVIGSFALTTNIRQASDGGTWAVTGPRQPRHLRHVYWEPAGLTGTQMIFGLIQETSQFSTFPSSITSVTAPWRLYSIDGDLTWVGMSTSNFTIEVDRFTHTTPIVDGQTNSIGMQLTGAAVDLWVNGVKNSFTRTESGGWTVFSGGGTNVATYEFGATRTPAPLPGTLTHLMTGKAAEIMHNNNDGDYNLPERFFQDLAMQLTHFDIALDLQTETETVFELEVAPDLANQSILIDMVTEADAAFDFGQVPPAIQTLVETSSVYDPVVPTGPIVAQGVGRINMVDVDIAFFAAELRVRILDSTVLRAPTSITITMSGGVAETDVDIAIDGTYVWTTSTDSDGNLGPTSINLTTTLGTLGDHVLSATQTTVDGVTTGSASFTVLRAPSPYPGVAGVDAPPVEVPGALVYEGTALVRHWVFQDLLAEEEGGIGSYVLPHNPSSMTSPHFEHALTSRHSTASDGKIHVFQAGNTPKEWEFSGYCPSQAQQERMSEYRYLNRRFYVIDHRNRAWKVAMVSADFTPRLRQDYNGIPTDWGSDYKMTVVVLDQNPLTPEEV